MSNEFASALKGMVNQIRQEEFESSNQLSLGGLIFSFKEYPQDYNVVTLEGKTLGETISYRGYYNEIAIEPIEADVLHRSVFEVLKTLQESVGKTFEGYKGGEYTMDESTPIWVASYGCSGKEVIATQVIHEERAVVVLVKQDGD